MIFENIDNCFREKGLSLPNLSLLIPDEHTYEILLLQPEGRLIANNSCICHIDRSEAEKKNYEFLKLASAKRVELAVTPEYSCPWNVIEKVLLENIFPDIHNIWVIGCESITVQDLNEITSRNTQYKWIFDENILKQHGDFVNPVCYLFNAYNISGNLEHTVLIQFKTNPMGDGGIGIERDHMITGNKIYYIRNNEDSIHLATLICSDANGFEYNILKKLLLIHIELNSIPNHDAFKIYRNKCFIASASQDQEIICLNWAKQTKISIEGTAKSIDINHSNSAYYTKANILLTDDRICNNHGLGLYYTYWKTKYTHTLFFNYSEHIFHLRCTKPWQGMAMAATAYKTGPEMICCYSWNDRENSWENSEKLDTGAVAFCERCTDIECPLKSNNLTPINKERLVTFSTGMAEEVDWLLPCKLSLLHIDDSEIIKRLTFAQNNHNEANIFRERYLSLFHSLRTDILIHEHNFPSFLKFLFGNCCLWFDAKYKSYNLYKRNENDNNPIAGGVYIGETQDHIARLKYEKIISSLDECDKKTFLLWYRTRGEIKCLNYGLPSACDTHEGDFRSIIEG